MLSLEGLPHIPVVHLHAAAANADFEGRMAKLNFLWRLFGHESITVSSAWESTAVSMRYSQWDGVNTSLSRLMYCTHECRPCLDVSIRDSFCVVSMVIFRGTVMCYQGRKQ